MADLTQILLAASKADQQAEQALREWESRNVGELAQALALELSTEGKPIEVRHLAAIFLKNLLAAQDKGIRGQKLQRWQGIDDGAKHNIKHALLGTLRSPVAGHFAALAASEVAAIEVPYNTWPEFLAGIFENVSHPDIPEGCKVASLECLGFTCERVGEMEDAPQIDSATTDRMLTTIVEGAQPTKSDAIRLKATQALRNSLVFASKNMEQKRERDAIMNTICEASQAKSPEVRAVAFECLSSIAQYYYDKLQEYMTTIYQLTTTSIKTDEDTVAKQAVEFWSTLSEIEQELLDEQAELVEREMPVERPCNRYVAAAMELLVPLLLEYTLTKQDEDDVEQDDYNLHHAGHLCLSFIAQTVEDAIVPVAMPFVTQHIQSENWRYRDAAIMAFTSVLDGPSSDVIGPYAHQAIPLLLNALNDAHPLVQDTAAHCIGRICLLHVRAIPPDVFPALVQSMMAKLADGVSPGIARQACTAINNLASAFTDENEATNALSQYMPALLQSLLQCADRPTDDQGRLRETAITTMTALIHHSAQDVKEILVQLLPAIIQRLSQTFNSQEFIADDRESRGNMQGLLCALIQVLCQKLDKASIQQYADSIMTNLLHVLQSRASCHDEALLVVSALADVLEADFANYMPALQPFLVASLRNFEAYQLCKTAVGTVGDISRAIESRLTPYCDDIMTALIEALRDGSVDRSVKPPVIQCFGEIAMAIGGAFENYLNFAIMLLLQASGTTAYENDDEMIDYVNQLRETILEAYTGIFQGLRDGNMLHLLIPHLNGVVQFLQLLAVDPNRDELVLGRAVGLIGDLSQMMGPTFRPELQKEYVKALINDALNSEDENLIETARWAMTVMNQTLTAN